VPVVVLIDEVIGHLVETVDLEDLPDHEEVWRKWATGPAENHQPYEVTEDKVPPMAYPGDGYRTHTTGLTHAPNGFPTQSPDLAAAALERTTDKLVLHRDKIESFRKLECDDADVLIAAIGISARAARQSVRDLRAQGIKAGLFRPVTLWPFPEEALQEVVKKSGAKTVIVPEMNQGQMVLEVDRLLRGKASVIPLNRIDGEAISPDDITAKAREVAQ